MSVLIPARIGPGRRHQLRTSAVVELKLCKTSKIRDGIQGRCHFKSELEEWFRILSAIGGTWRRSWRLRARGTPCRLLVCACPPARGKQSGKNVLPLCSLTHWRTRQHTHTHSRTHAHTQRTSYPARTPHTGLRQCLCTPAHEKDTRRPHQPTNVPIPPPYGRSREEIEA